MDRKHMDIKEFKDFGYLQEVNRLFFHPHGLALEVSWNEKDGHWLSGIWDYRNDDQGVIFGPNVIDREKADRVSRAWYERCEKRQRSDPRLFYSGAIQMPTPKVDIGVQLWEYAWDNHPEEMKKAYGERRKLNQKER